MKAEMCHVEVFLFFIQVTFILPIIIILYFSTN